MKNQDLLHSVTLQLSSPHPQQRQYLEIIEKALSVDKQIDEINVKKDISHTENSISVKISAKDIKLLRACVTGLIRHVRLVAETIKEFKDIE